MQEQEGIALVKDVLYILKKVCQLTKEQNSDSEGNDADNIEEDIVAENYGLTEGIEENVVAEDNVLTEGDNTESNEASTQNNGNDNIYSTGSPDILKERCGLTMPEAMILLEDSLIFIPIIFKNILEHDSSLNKYFEDLCYALSERFPNILDYAQPAEFWSYYRKSKVVPNISPTKGKSPEKSKRNPNRSSDEEICEDEMEVDDVEIVIDNYVKNTDSNTDN